MSCCTHCEDAGGFFNQSTAQRDLRRYRRRGPSGTTRQLIDALQMQQKGDATLLDIGGGVGAIAHDFLQGGFQKAVQVDASAPYLEASEQEARRQGHGDRMAYLFGDFVDLAPTLDVADVVTLDRVVCCYPDMERLVTASAEKARHLIGLVFPRERLLTRSGLKLANVWFRLRGSAFRTYLHSTEELERVLRRCGFRRTSWSHSVLWQVVTFERTAGGQSGL